MDHLPYPQDSPLPPLSVPYHTKYKFDGGTFTDFPVRCGFDKTNFGHGDFRSIPWNDQTAFFQAWLFFGVIHECLSAPAEDFLDHHTGTITTRELPRWTQKWRKDLPFSRSKRQAEYNRVQKCLRETCAALIALDGIEADKSFAANLSEEVAFSIAVLGITIDQVMIKYDVVTHMGGDAQEKEQLTQLNVWPTTRYAKKRLESAGWCRSETKRLERYMKATGIYYCGSMELVGRQVDHSRCEDSGCKAENVVEATYVTSHADNCMHGQKEAASHCDHVGPIVSEVASILDSENLPLLELRRDSSSEEVQLRAVPYKESISYTALSHVWADGMGNPHANTLPQCQIDRLHALLTPLASHSSLKSKFWSSKSTKAETVYIWMDTLLIPLEKRLRKKAISRMYDIYKNARNVLVLDRSLLDVSADRPGEELCFRLSAASWMRRAWTLQEGALANNLFVQFSERAANPVKLAGKAYERIWKSEPWNAILEDCGAVINAITQSGDAGEDLQPSHVLEGLGQRSTSHPEDREICFAVMLKMDMKKILDVTGAERTWRIVQQMPYIPRSFVWHTQPGLEMTGSQWIPRDIISSGAGVPQLGFQLNNQGLLAIEEAALVFRGRTHYLGKSAQHIRDAQTGTWYALRWEGDGAEAKKLVESERTWTVLVALPNRMTMFNTLHAVILRLDWVLQSPSSEELLGHVMASGTITGEFVGRGMLHELDDATTQRMTAQTGVRQENLQEFREDVRSGKSSLEGLSEAMKRLYVEEGDDSWYILDGVMQRVKRKWLIT